MRAGQLNRRITIERKTGGVDAIGQPLPEGWEEVVTVWAHIKHLSGSETIKAGAEVSAVRASIRIRYRTGLDAGMRVLHGETVYQIKAVLPDEARRDHVDLVCEVVK